MERHDETTARSQQVLLLCRLIVLACSESEPCNGAERCVLLPDNRAARAAGGADRPLSGFGTLTDANGLYLSVGGRRGSSLGAKQSGSHGSGAGRCDAEAAVGSQHQVTHRDSPNIADDE